MRGCPTLYFPHRGCNFRGSKYNMEKTKRKLVLFYHYRREYPCYYKDFSYDDPKIKRVLDKGAFLPLPAYDALGRRILVSYVHCASSPQS